MNDQQRLKTNCSHWVILRRKFEH